VVLVVVQVHGLGVDEGFESGIVVGKRCEFVSHFGEILRWCGCDVVVKGCLRQPNLLAKQRETMSGAKILAT